MIEGEVIIDKKESGETVLDHRTFRRDFVLLMLTSLLLLMPSGERKERIYLQGSRSSVKY